MRIIESDNRKWVVYDDAEATAHDAEFLSKALDAAADLRGKQALYGSRATEDVEDLKARIWKAGMNREWGAQYDLLITLAATIARNARVAYALAHPELCADVLPAPPAPGPDAPPPPPAGDKSLLD